MASEKSFYGYEFDQMMKRLTVNSVFQNKTYEQIKQIVIEDKSVDVNFIKVHILLKCIKDNDNIFLENLILNKHFNYSKISEIFLQNRRDLFILGVDDEFIKSKDYLLEDDTFNSGLICILSNMCLKQNSATKYFTIDILYGAKLAGNSKLIEEILKELI
jgi:hypothetical protein